MYNTASSDSAYAGGGQHNMASGDFSFAMGGNTNTASGYGAVALGGYMNFASNYYSAVGGGRGNYASGYLSAVGGGLENEASGWASAVGGGSKNVALGENSAVLGGYANTAVGENSFVAGGYSNTAVGTNSFAAGSFSVATHAYAAVLNFYSSGGPKYCASMGENTANFCGVAGGVMTNGVTVPINMVDMTNFWRRNPNGAVLYYACIVGGQHNTVHEEYATVIGGYGNYAAEESTTVGGGFKNKAFSNYATVIGGFMNQASGRFSTVLGGSQNYARGRFAFAAGFLADATKDYSAAFGFRGNGDDAEKCATRLASEVAICADVVTINGEDVLGMKETRGRELAWEASEGDAKEMSELRGVMEAQAKRMAAQDKLLHELSVALDALSVRLES